MGLSSSKLFEAFNSFGNTHTRILLLGLDDAGKTTIFYKLNENVKTDVTIIPTIGFSVEEISPVKNLKFTTWDLVGQKNSRNWWRKYYPGSAGVIFVIDSSNVSRIPVAREELFVVMKDGLLDPGIPLVVLSNKQDLSNALKSWELIEKLGLRDLKTNPWYVQEMCALNGEGLYEGIIKMAEMVKTFRNGKR